MPRSWVLSLSILFVTAGVMIIWTAIRYSQRSSDRQREIEMVGSGSSSDLRDMKWDLLPKVSEFELTDRDGRAFHSGQMDGDVWVVSFFFTRCPSICREQNNQLAQLGEAYFDRGVKFVSITCDPNHDTPPILREYAATFNAEPSSWRFLTGELDSVKAVSEGIFMTALSPDTHGTNFMIVDRWGRFRDRVDWQNPADSIRLRVILDQLLKETEPPTGVTVQTRTPPDSESLDQGHSVEADDLASDDVASDDLASDGTASDGTASDDTGSDGTASDNGTSDDSAAGDSPFDHGDWRDQPWIESFTLTERSGELFFSESLDGQVWVGSFFFASCPSICRQQNNHLAELREQLGDRDVTFLSITTDPDNDTPAKLREYADTFDADPDKWLFLTGDFLHVRRIASEYFQTGFMSKEGHTTKLVVFDKTGEPRGTYTWENPEDLVELRRTIDRLLIETYTPDSDENATDSDQQSEQTDSSDNAVGDSDQATWSCRPMNRHPSCVDRATV